MLAGCGGHLVISVVCTVFLCLSVPRCDSAVAFCLVSHGHKVSLFDVGFLENCSCSTGEHHRLGVSARQTPGDSC